MNKKQRFEQLKKDVAESMSFYGDYTAENIREMIETSAQRRYDDYDYEDEWFANLSGVQQTEVIIKRLDAFRRASKIQKVDDNKFEITILWPDCHGYEPYGYGVFDDLADIDTDNCTEDYFSEEEIDPFCSLRTVIIKLDDDISSENPFDVEWEEDDEEDEE